MTKLEWVRLVGRRERERAAAERQERLTQAAAFLAATGCPSGCGCRGSN